MVLFLIGVEIESENWNFLSHGTMGKHPMQSLYTGSYHTVISVSGFKTVVPVQHTLIEAPQERATLIHKSLYDPFTINYIV